MDTELNRNSLVAQDHFPIQYKMAVVKIRIRNWSAVFEGQDFCRLFIALLLKLYSKLGQLEQIVVSHMLKSVENGQWPAAISSTEILVWLCNITVLMHIKLSYYFSPLSHEKSSGYYSVLAYFIVTILFDLLPLRFIPTVISCPIIYYMIGKIM